MKGTDEFQFPEIDMKATGVHLRRLCKEKQISVKIIQECLHIASNQAVYVWFNGKSMPSLDNLVALSDLLGVPMDELVIRRESNIENQEERTREC